MRFLFPILLFAVAQVYAQISVDSAVSNRQSSELATTHNRLDGFVGIKWGSSKADLRKSMAQRAKVKFDRETPDKAALIQKFYGGEFAGHKVDDWLLFVCDKGFYRAALFMNCNTETELSRVYDDLKDGLTRKYGTPSVDLHSFDSPYEEDGEKYLKTALRLEKAHVQAEWDMDGGIIVIKMLEEQIMTVYHDIKIDSYMDSKEDQKNQNDY